MNTSDLGSDRITFRELRAADELAALCEFERRIWGEGDVVSLNMIVATIDEGGMAIGAFAPANDASSEQEAADVMVGAVYGFPSRESGVLHSHYMAVDPGHRRNGLGVTLKQRQRDWCLANGYTTMRWTYDPLQIPNGHLNLRVLGAVGVSYHENHYGRMGGLNGELPSDRVTVQWSLAGARPNWRQRQTVDVAPVTADDIAVSNDVALAARLQLRAALQDAMRDGWKLVDVDRKARQYVLAR